jgi:magnesium transporter
MSTDLEAVAPPITIRAVSLDFETRQDTPLERDEIGPAIRAGHAVWFDIEIHDAKAARKSLLELELISEDILEDALFNDPVTRIARFESYIHLVVAGCRPSASAFELERVDVVVGQNYVATLHRGPALFLSRVLRGYRADFQRYAKSLNFLLYEFWDTLIDNYLEVQKLMEERVDQLQNELRARVVSDKVFAQISELSADVLHLRKILLPTRTVLKDLATRRTLFVNEATQQFLANMVGTVETVLQDLLVDRDVLSGSLNLYMSMVSHRTNEVMKRLTVVSVIFLPLTFLVGVYGMNFEVLPELEWRYGYLYFWIVVLIIVGGLLWFLRRQRVL